jgi:outer membrane protein OmpA-like peptidoglycan-associated protein
MTTSSSVTSLFSILDSRKLSEIASHLGEPPQAVSMGLESSTAALIGGLANKASDSTWMNQIFNLVSQAPPNVNVSDLANTVTGPSRGSPATSSLLDAGRGFLSLIFGQNQSAVIDAVGKSTGLRSSVVSSLMSLAAPLLMTTLGRLVRDGHMNASGLKDLVMREYDGVRSLLPAGFSDLLRGTQVPTPASTTGTRPIALGTVSEASSRNWLWWIPALLILLPLLYWGWARFRPPTASTAPLGSFVTRTLPGNVSLNIPQYGMETQLLGFIQDPSKGVDQTYWINFDRLLFDTNSATLRPESGEQLRNVASILIAYPNTHVKIGGYTDNTGDSQSNHKLSQDRADGVMAELVTLGVSPDRMEAQGYGEQYPVADNSTEDGRAKNRRIAMNVTQK